MKILFSFAWILTVMSCKNDKPIETAEPTPNIALGLVTWIPLDGSAFDTIGNVMGNVINATSTTNRNNEPDRAMFFNANDSSRIEFGDIPAATLSTNSFSICCWVYVTDTSNAGAIFSKRGIYGPFEYSLDNHFDHSVFNFDNWISNGGNTVYGVDPLKASAPIPVNQWIHLTYTGDGNALRVYVNDILQSEVDMRTSTNSFENTDAPFVIGNGGGYGKNYFFNGKIDNVRIYNRVLDLATITYLSET